MDDVEFIHSHEEFLVLNNNVDKLKLQIKERDYDLQKQQKNIENFKQIIDFNHQREQQQNKKNEEQYLVLERGNLLLLNQIKGLREANHETLQQMERAEKNHQVTQRTLETQIKDSQKVHDELAIKCQQLAQDFEQKNYITDESLKVLGQQKDSALQELEDYKTKLQILQLDTISKNECIVQQNVLITNYQQELLTWNKQQEEAQLQIFNHQQSAISNKKLIDDLKDELQGQRNSFLSQSSSSDNLKNENSRIAEKASQLQENYILLQNEFQKKAQTIDQQLIDLVQKQNMIEELTTQNQAIQERLEAQSVMQKNNELDITESKKAIESLREKLEISETTIFQLKSANEQLDKELIGVNETNSELQKAIKELQLKNVKLRESMRSNSSLNDELIQMFQVCQDKSKDLENQLSLMVIQHEIKEADFVMQIKQLEKQLQITSAELLDQRQLNTISLDQVENQLKYITGLKQELNSIIKRSVDQDKANNQQNEIQQENKILKEQIRQLEESSNRLKDELETFNSLFKEDSLDTMLELAQNSVAQNLLTLEKQGPEKLIENSENLIRQLKQFLNGLRAQLNDKKIRLEYKFTQ